MSLSHFRSHMKSIRRLSGFIPNIPYTVKVRPVGKMRIRLRLNKGFWLHDVFEHERHQLGVMKALIKPGDVVYDVGANIGYTVRFMAGNCQAGHVYAFEPVSFNRELLEQNIDLGGIRDRVTVLPIAASDSDGEIEFTLDDFTGSTGYIGRVKDVGETWEMRWGTSFRKIKVPMVKLDTLIESGEVRPPTLIKVDIEGAEEFMIAGARQLLAKHKPRLVMELHSLGFARNTMRQLDDLGYFLSGHHDLLDGSERRMYTRSDIESATDFKQLPWHLYASCDRAELDRPMPPYADERS